MYTYLNIILRIDTFKKKERKIKLKSIVTNNKLKHTHYSAELTFTDGR